MKTAKEMQSLPAVAESRGLTLPEGMDFVEDDAGLGLSNVGAEDQAIPFISLLQQLSPQVQKRKDSYVDGSEPGMIYNTVTGEIYDGDVGILVVPVAYTRSLLEWRPREMGGGFAGKHPCDTVLLNTCERNEKGQEVLPNGNLLVNTAHHYVLLLKPDGGFELAVITMASTQLKKSRKWNTMMKSIILKRRDGTPFVPPSFLYTYKLTSVLESKNDNSWFGWGITNAGMLTDNGIYAAAKEAALAVGEGRVTARETASPIEEASFGDEKIPF